MPSLGVCASSALLDNVTMQHFVAVCTEESQRQGTLLSQGFSASRSFFEVSSKSFVPSANLDENRHFTL